jgi:hypothetical protein
MSRMERASYFENLVDWSTVRPARAVSPRGDADAARRAYLELLKLCLCDLHGTTTTTVERGLDDSVVTHELRGDDVRLRVGGLDWPMHGLTMVGLPRLDDLQACVEAVVRDGVPGDLIETGTWRGGASMLMRATLDTLGATDRTVWLADSFAGFPARDEQHPDREGLSVFDFLAVPQEEVEASFERLGLSEGVRFLPGFFADTLPGLTGERWAVVRLDGDSYEATWTALEALYPRLEVGGYLIVDDYVALRECREAVEAFRDRHGITEPLEEVDWTCRRWRRTSDAPIEVPGPAAAPPAPERAERRPVQRPRDPHIPTAREAELRRRLAAVEAELERLRSSLVHRGAAWLRRRARG